jgi:hypothetical protein
MLRAPKSFQDRTLSPEYQALALELDAHLEELHRGRCDHRSRGDSRRLALPMVLGESLEDELPSCLRLVEHQLSR